MVHKNKEDYHRIKSHADILNRTLLNHVNNTELMAYYEEMDALEVLDEILSKELELMIECQENRNII
jgi:hypothetical protein